MSANLNPIANYVKTYREASVMIETWKEIQKAAREKIEATMGEHETGLVNGSIAVTWSHYSDTRLDGPSLKEAMPEVWDKFTKTTTKRRFDVKPSNEDEDES